MGEYAKRTPSESDLRTRIAAVLDGHVAGWYYDCCPEGEKHVGEWSQHVADAVIRELEPLADTITDAVEDVVNAHEFERNGSVCSCGLRNNLDGDVLYLHRISLIGSAIRGVLGVTE